MPDSTASEAGGFAALLKGLVGYAGEKYVDTKFPTVNQNANALAEKQKSDALAAEQQRLQTLNTYKPWIIGGAVVLGLVVVGAVVFRATK